MGIAGLGMARAATVVPLVLPFLLGASSCTESARPPPAPSPMTVEERARDLAAALGRRDWAAVAGTAAPDAEVLVEIRQVLTETDEREATTLRGRPALLDWLKALEPGLEARADARWPAGFHPSPNWTAFSSCVDAASRVVPPGTLAIRRMCFSDARTTPPGLSYLVLAEAR